MSAITISKTVHAPIEVVWEKWTTPMDIVFWCHASDDWHVPKAVNDVKVGGRFVTTMAAKDGSQSFDFGGEYTDVIEHELLRYIMDDARKVEVHFKTVGDTTIITETFDAEHENSEELQRTGWQAILDNFAHYTESTQHA